MLNKIRKHRHLQITPNRKQHSAHHVQSECLGSVELCFDEHTTTLYIQFSHTWDEEKAEHATGAMKAGSTRHSWSQLLSPRSGEFSSCPDGSKHSNRPAPS